ncbi:glycoside hydrolase family 5 protein [Mixia osmundae IAM 14324]|uniref:glucan 1,3-beta-glucosidase n=1 Tax=Mixia osmundae (strain CBS 9802 / IAM 14324 / JCM 22182 / KY 12970) TaxID=764103 RepID=G7E8N2_MIXOS|nr:glycoside hydrolase family 5 protein [Mixia osmundae IAM 14324]KEI40134.1 glycoside hydrolase family 5 protein [Mixia osmundae IAM 14324]GAA99500.1 hypothetical protein E5Q_06200 [Mixia osmundae IAM 14324]
MPHWRLAAALLLSSFAAAQDAGLSGPVDDTDPGGLQLIVANATATPDDMAAVTVTMTSTHWVVAATSHQQMAFATPHAKATAKQNKKAHSKSSASPQASTTRIARGKAKASVPANTTQNAVSLSKLINVTDEWDWTTFKANGVNIGNWQVLESWMNPTWFASIAAGTGAVDEWTLAEYRGHKIMGPILTQHWDTWITEKDVQTLSDLNVNMMRIPVGFWAWGNVTGVMAGEPYYIGDRLSRIQRLIEWGALHNIYSVIDMHGMPGSQSGNDHTGHVGPKLFFQPANQQRSRRVIQVVSDWIDALPKTTRSWVAGLEVVNEPQLSATGSWYDKTYEPVLKSFYHDSYNIIQNGNTPKKTTVIHDAFYPPGTGVWDDFMLNVPKNNLVLSSHPYYHWDTYSDAEAAINTYKSADWFNYPRPLWLNEWSLSLPDDCVNSYTESSDWYQRFWQHQVGEWYQFAGHAFWSIKTIDNPPWSLEILANAIPTAIETVTTPE